MSNAKTLHLQFADGEIEVGTLIDALYEQERTIAILRQHKNDYMEAAEGTRKALEAENARLERLVSHWQGLAVTNRKVADDALAQLAAWQRTQSAGAPECSCNGQQRLIGGGCDACNLHDDIHQLAFETGEPDENASGYWFELEQFDEFVAELRVLLARQSGAVPPGYLLVSLYDLIEGDNYGVEGSDFQYCKLCQRESGAGMLNHGIPHEASCPLAAAPSAHDKQSGGEE